MQRCEFCGSPVPASAHFCGIKGLSVSLSDQGPTRAAAQSTDRGASSASMLQMLSAEQATSNPSIPVGVMGTFDASVQVSASWLPGVHTIHATEGFGSRSGVKRKKS